MDAQAKAIDQMKRDGTAWLIDRVNYGQECPCCGEDRMDYLVWDDDGETVRCATCGVTYAPEVY